MELPFVYKYQPIHLTDFEIDTELLTLIQTLIKVDTLNVLFVGDVGSGKTTIIKAIIREYYNTNKSYADDVLSINSLKEQGITYYRNDVKTFCQTACSISGRKKIIILDDLDNVNEQSQQVFRNCIDKYSHNVHFIASCCNTQKVIDSLQSRMNIIKIKAPIKENLLTIVNKISTIEHIKIDADAVDFIISICNNSIKALINYLEKFKLLECEIDINLATNICTNISFNDFITYTDLCRKCDYVSAIKLIYTFFDCGYSVMDILDSYFIFVKTTPMLTEDEKYKICPLICKYITMFYIIHEDEIELALFTHNLTGIFSKSII